MKLNFYRRNCITKAQKSVSTVPLDVFEKLLAEIKSLIDEEGLIKMNALKLIKRQAIKFDLIKSA